MGRLYHCLVTVSTYPTIIARLYAYARPSPIFYELGFKTIFCAVLTVNDGGDNNVMIHASSRLHRPLSLHHQVREYHVPEQQRHLVEQHM